MSNLPQPTNPLAASSLTIERPSSIASQSSQQSLHNGSYSHMSDTTLGDTSSASAPSSPREPTSEHPEPQQQRNTIQPLTLPNQPAPSDDITTNDSIPFRAQKGYAHATWARTFHSRPELLLKPQSIEELQKILALARRHRRLLVTVGAGHSPSDLTCTSSWMLSLENMARVLDIQTYGSSASTSGAANGLNLTPSDTHPDPKQAPPRYAGRALVQAGITLENLNLEARKHGLTLPNLGSIHIQSLAGAIATATHGSSMRHGIISSSVRGLRIMLASGELRWCSANQDADLFRAALVSLGALGVVTEIEIELAPQRNVEWNTTLWELDDALAQWHKELWTKEEFVRCWWMPYTRRLVVWKGDKTDKEAQPAGASQGGIGGWLGFHAYQSMLLLSNWVPRLVPFVEWLFMGLAHGFKTGPVASGIEEQRTALLMDCLYSQFVNEWAVPFEKGPEAITRLDKWLRGLEGSGIPFNNKGLYAHSPIEVRVGNTGASERQQHQLEGEGSPAERNRAFLDFTCEKEPTLYLNATLYRPYGSPPPWKDQYYAAFEWLMKDLGGRPHWAKNFSSVTREELEGMYGNGLRKWRAVRADVDPKGMFCGEWHRRLVLEGEAPSNRSRDIKFRRMDCEEEELSRKTRWSGGVFWNGQQAVQASGVEREKEEAMRDDLMKSVTKISPDR